MRTIVTIIGIVLFALLSLSVAVSAHGEASPEDFGLTEGALIRSSSAADPDIYIVSATGYKRLILSPTIFSIYGHLRWDQVVEVGSGVRDAYQTSAFFRNCETGDPKVYALEVTSDDIAELHWINVSAEDAVLQDDDFFKKVFCMIASGVKTETRNPPGKINGIDVSLIGCGRLPRTYTGTSASDA